MNIDIDPRTLGTPARELAKFREYVRRIDDPADFFKSAQGPGEGGEGDFEKAFSGLAYSYIKDKAPRLMDYAVGFQLVERNEDNTKAVGVFGFKVGDNWYYGPVFFLTGELKGHDLLYIKQQNVFVPMHEKWVNYLISRKPSSLGKGTDKSLSEMGMTAPDLSRLRMSSSTKTGSARFPDWLLPFGPQLAATALKMASSIWPQDAPAGAFVDVGRFPDSPVAVGFAAGGISLSRLLNEDATFCKLSEELARNYPLIRQGFDTFYGADAFEKAARFRADRAADADCIVSNLPVRAGAPAAPADAPLLGWAATGTKSAAIKIVIRSSRTISPGEFTLSQAEADAKADDTMPYDMISEGAPANDADREKLIADGLLIKDDRSDSEVSIPYAISTSVGVVSPNETGLYDLLERPAHVTRAFVAINPTGNTTGKPLAVVVRPAGESDPLLAEPSVLFTLSSPGPERDAYRKWFEDLPSVSTLKDGDTVIVVTADRGSTIPLSVNGAAGENCWSVYGRDYVSGDMTNGFRQFASPSRGNYDAGSSHWHQRRGLQSMRISGHEGIKLRINGDELIVPKDAKIVRTSERMCSCEMTDGGRKSKTLRPAKLRDVQELFYKSTDAMKISADRGIVRIETRRGVETRSEKAALVSLVAIHGFRRKVAEDLLAEARKNRSVERRVKYAEGLEGGPDAPAIPPAQYGQETVGRGSVQSAPSQEVSQSVPGMSSSRTDQQVYDPFYEPDREALGQAQRASQSGQKEIFDTAMVGVMAKSYWSNSTIDKELGPMMKCLDSLGRTLFYCYWHPEEFAERYGKDDTSRLESEIQDAFRKLGSVCLTLKEKQIGGMDDIAASKGTANA